jgi:predicted acetyltransferase
LRDLWQLYMSELAEFRKSVVLVDGRFRDDRLLTYLSYEDHWPLIVKSENEIAGFALIRKSKPGTHVIGEFFIKPQFRRIGMGTLVVSQIVRRFPGNWEIPFQEENAKAAIFWRRTISQLGCRVTEVESPGLVNPDLSHDVWLRFTFNDID